MLLLGDTQLNQNIFLKEAGKSFQHFSNSYMYTLKDEYYHCLTSSATINISNKCPIIGKQVMVILFI